MDARRIALQHIADCEAEVEDMSKEEEREFWDELYCQVARRKSSRVLVDDWARDAIEFTKGEIEDKLDANANVSHGYAVPLALFVLFCVTTVAVMVSLIGMIVMWH